MKQFELYSTNDSSEIEISFRKDGYLEVYFMDHINPASKFLLDFRDLEQLKEFLNSHPVEDKSIRCGVCKEIIRGDLIMTGEEDLCELCYPDWEVERVRKYEEKHGR